MKRKKIVKRTVLCTLLVLLAMVLYIALGTTLPYIKHLAASSEAVNKALSAQYRGDGTQSEKIKNITDNEQALLYRLKLIAEAKEEIVLATFEFSDDNSGRDVMSALWCAAERGVKVKLIIDGYKASVIKKSPFMQLLASHQNADVRFYNELNPLFPWKAQSRLHEKYFICDKDIYLLGGRNTNDRFLGDYPSKLPNCDREVLVFSDYDNEDSSARALYDYFEEYFALEDCKSFTGNSKISPDIATERYNELKEKYSSAFDSAPIDTDAFTAKKITLITGDLTTGNRAPDVWYQITELMKTGEEILIQTPYIMCGDEMYDDLTSLASEKNVKIFINSPATGSNVFGGADYICEKDDVLAIGMTIYEYTSDLPFHSKTIVIDSDITVVGSLNFDMRSIYLDSELMLVIESEELNSAIRSEFDVMEEASRCISPSGEIYDGEGYFEPEKTFWDNTKRFFIKILTRPIRYLL